MSQQKVKGRLQSLLNTVIAIDEIETSEFILMNGKTEREYPIYSGADLKPLCRSIRGANYAYRISIHSQTLTLEWTGNESKLGFLDFVLKSITSNPL